MRINQLGKNATEVETLTAIVLYSYSTPVAARISGRAYRTAKRHSNTTSRHINAWLNGTPAEEKPQEWFDRLIE